MLHAARLRVTALQVCSAVYYWERRLQKMGTEVHLINLPALFCNLLTHAVINTFPGSTAA